MSSHFVDGKALGHVRYINILIWLSGQTSSFGGVFVVSKSLDNCETKETLQICNFVLKVSEPFYDILYRTWPIIK